MSLSDFNTAQHEVDVHFAKTRHFESLVPLVVRMYVVVKAAGLAASLAQASSRNRAGREREAETEMS